MEEGRDAYRRGPGHSRLHPYEGPNSPREQFYGGPPRDTFRRPSYDRGGAGGFSSPLGRAGSFNGPVSPDRERLRGFSPERRPYSPERERRAYSPDRMGDRDRAPRYHVQERPHGYRPRDDGFRREAYGYRGDESRVSARSREPSPDNHFGHHSAARDQLQSPRDRAPEHDPHPRPLSREGTPLEGWAQDRSGKPHHHSSHSHGALRSGVRASSTAPSSSGPLRGAANNDNGPSSNGDLEAGEVAPGPGPGPGLRDLAAARPSTEEHHGPHHSTHHHHHHQSHHGHHGHGQAQQSLGHHGGPGHQPSSRPSAGSQQTLRGGGSSGGWESRSNHPSQGPGAYSGAAHRDGQPPPPPPRDGGRDSGGRDAGREAARDAYGRGDGSREPRDTGREARDAAKPAHRATSASAGAGLRSPTGASRPDGSFSREASAGDRDRDREMGRERDRERSLRGSPSYAARSSSQGTVPPSPGRSPRGASSDGTAAADDTAAPPTANAMGGEVLEHRQSYGGAGGGGRGAVAAPGGIAADHQQRHSAEAGELERRFSSGADAPSQLQRAASGGSSHGQGEAAPPPARISTAGSTGGAPPSNPGHDSLRALRPGSASALAAAQAPAAEAPVTSALAQAPHDGAAGLAAGGGSKCAVVDGPAIAALPSIPSADSLDASAAPAVAPTAAAVEAEPGELLSEGEPDQAVSSGHPSVAQAEDGAAPAQQVGEPFVSAAWREAAASALAPGAGSAQEPPAPGRDDADGGGPERAPSVGAASLPLGGGAGAAGDDLAAERKSSLTIRRFGFGRARRSLPAKSAGDAAAEEGELPGTSSGGVCERTTSGPGRGQAAGEAMDVDTAAAGPSQAAQAAHTAPGHVAAAAAVAPLPDAPADAAAAAAAASSRGLLGSLPPILTTLDPGIRPKHGGLPTPMTAPAAALIPAASPVPGGSAPAHFGLDSFAGASGSTHMFSPLGAAASTPVEAGYPHAAPQDVVHSAQLGGHEPQQQLQQQQPTGADASSTICNPAETVAGLSQQIEHLETEITDLERQLSALVAEARSTQAEASALEAEVGALDERLLQDTSSGEEASGDESEDEADVGPDLDAGVDRSGANAVSFDDSAAKAEARAGSAAAPAAASLGRAPVETAAVPAVTPAVGRPVRSGPPTAAGPWRSDARNPLHEEAAARSQEAEYEAASAALAQSLKPRGRPRSTAKTRAAEAAAAAAAAAAADSRRKTQEQQSRARPDGLLHLPAQQFKPCFLRVTRASISCWREEVLRLLPDDLAERVRTAVSASAAQQMRVAGAAPLPGNGRWATVVPLVAVRVEPMYQEPQDLPAFHANAARHVAVFGAVCRYLRQRRQLVAAKQEVLVAQYTRHMAEYKVYMQTEGRRPPAPPPPPPTGRGSGAASYGMYAASRATSAYNPYAYSHSDVIRSDLDEQRLLNNFIAVEQLKHMCALPDMLLDPWERRWRAYDNRNGLVLDPVRELEEERMIKSWAEEERTQFMDRFLQHPKDFRKISTYLPGRSQGDCVAFFYKNQKLDEFGTVRRKQQLKKRRLQADMRKQQPLLMAPMIARQRGMGPGGVGGPGDAGLRGGTRGRGGVRSAAVRGPRGTTLMDPDNMASLGLGGSGLPASGMPRPLPGGPGSLPPFQSMITTAHRAAEHRELPSAPLLPPISASATVQPTSPLYQQQQSVMLPSGSSAAANWTDEDFIECYRQHGKSWEAYCRHLGIRSESAAKQYFYRHKERLGLDRIQPNNIPSIGSVDGTGVTVIAAVSAVGPSRKAALGVRLPNDHVATPAAVAAAAAAAAAAAGAPGGLGEPQAPTIEPFAGRTGPSPSAAADESGPSAMDARDDHFPETLQAAALGTSTQSPVILIPKGASGRRRGPARVPANVASLSNGALLAGVSLESSELPLLESMRYRQDPDLEARSDSEFEPAAQGAASASAAGLASGAVGGEGDGAGGSLTQTMDLLAALRNPGGSSLSQLLNGGLLPPAGGSSSGTGGAGGQLGGMLGHLLLQPHQLEHEGKDSQQGLGALGAGLNLNMLGGVAGALQGGAGGTSLSLFTGPSGVCPLDDLSMQLPSPSDDGGAGGYGGAGVMGASGRRFGANYWSQEEKDAFLDVFQVHGRDWARLADAIPTKSVSQIKTYFHNYKVKLGLDKMELPPAATQPTGRRGQGRAARDSVGAPAPGGDTASEEERPAKRQAMSAGPMSGLNGQLDVGGAEGFGGSHAAQQPVPVMDLHALASIYKAGSQQQLLLGRERDAQGQQQAPELGSLLALVTSLHGGALAGSGPSKLSSLAAAREGEDARLFGPGDSAAASASARGPSPVPAGPADGDSGSEHLGLSADQLMGGGQQAAALSALVQRQGDAAGYQALALPRGALGGLTTLQLQALSNGGGGAMSLFSTGGLLAPNHQRQPQQSSAASGGKLQALNLEHGAADVLGERDRERDRAAGAPNGAGGLPAFRLATVAGGSGGLVLQDQYATLAQQLQLQALGAVGERHPGRAAQAREEGARAESSSQAPVLELLPPAKGGGQPTVQALDLASPVQAPVLPLDATLPASATGAQLGAALDAAGGGSRRHSDFGAAAAAAVTAGSAGGSRSARNSETAAGSGVGLAAAGDAAGDGGEPASKRQKRLSREGHASQRQGLDLAGSALSPGLAEAVAAARGLTVEEAQQLLLQQLQQEALAGGAAGQRLVSYELLREQRQQLQPRASNAAPTLNLGQLTGLQVLTTSGAGNTSGGSCNGLAQNVLRLIPLQTAPASVQQQQQQVAVPMGQGQAVSVADMLSSLHMQAGRGMVLQAAGGQGAGPYGLGGGSGIERLLASAQDANLGASGGQFVSLQAGRGGQGVAWPVVYGDQLVCLGQRAPLNLAQLLLQQQQQQQQPKDGERGGEGPNR